MPTSDQIREYREWRAKFINALWDLLQETDAPFVSTLTVFERVGGDQLNELYKSRLVNDLAGDFLIEDVVNTFGTTYPDEIKLTSLGRSEVQRWIAEDAPTDLIPVQPSQIFHNTFNAPVTSAAIVQGASDTTVNMQTAVGEQLSTLADKAKQLLDAWDAGFDDREAVQADIETIEEQSPSQPRLRTALRRVAAWAGGIVAGGVADELAGEVHQLAGAVIQNL